MAAAQQAGALGAAMCAAVSAGVFDTVEAAQESMGQGYSVVYTPRAEKREAYITLYEKYHELSRFLEGK